MEDIFFDNEKEIDLKSGIVYHANKKLLELRDGTYDVWYILELLDQCKYISKTLPVDTQCLGFKRVKDGYELIICGN